MMYVYEWLLNPYTRYSYNQKIVMIMVLHHNNNSNNHNILVNVMLWLTNHTWLEHAARARRFHLSCAYDQPIHHQKKNRAAHLLQMRAISNVKSNTVAVRLFDMFFLKFSIVVCECVFWLLTSTQASNNKTKLYVRRCQT